MAGRELAAVFRAKDEMSAEMDRIKTNIGELDNRFGGISSKAVAAGAAIGVATTAVIALGTAAFKMGEEVDEAFDSILIKSGAAGDALEQLQDDFNQVVKNVPTSFGDAANAIGLLHARTGQTGDALQELATQVLNLSRLTGTDTSENVRQVTRFFGDWGIATENQSEALDKLFRAAQMSGQSVSQLAQGVVQFGAPMRQLGIDMDTAISLFAKWEKEGVNVETVAGTMRIALAKMAEVGLDPAETFDRLVTTIREMEDPVEATSLAMEVFGKRGGADMAAAIREGRFAVDDYKAALEDAGDSINDAARKTDDAKQDMEKAWNELKVAAQPVVQTVFEAMNEALRIAIPLMKDFAANLRTIAEAFKAMKEGKVTWQEVAAAALGVETRPGQPGSRTDLSGITVNRPENLAGMTTANEVSSEQALEAAERVTGLGLTADEIKLLKKDKEDEREAARIARAAEQEAKREAAAALREAERIIKEQQRQAEREAEIEAQRANTIRELGQRRAQAVQDAEDAYQEARQNALDKADEQAEKAQAQFDREQALAAERKRLQDEMERALKVDSESRAGARLGVQQSREFEDIDIRRARELEDIQDRQAKQRRTDAEQARKDQDAIAAARFSGDSRAVTAAMLAAEQRKRAIADQAAEEMAALEKRRQREDEDFARKQARQADDLIQTRKDLAEVEQLRKDLAAPLEAFNKQVLADNLAEKIQEYYKAQEATFEAAEKTRDRRIDAAFNAEAQGIERAQNIGMTQQQILNNYNYGVQTNDALQELIDDYFDADTIRME